jgi:ABC-type transport system involved in multi-copper enzyme maturation permease subunit
MTSPSALPLISAISTWLTPYWLVATGVFVAMVVLGLAYCVVRLLSRRVTLAVHSSIGEGFLLPVLILGAVLCVFTVAVAFVVPFKPLVRSLSRITSATTLHETVDIPADAKNQEVEIGVMPAEVRLITITATQNMYFNTELPGAEQTLGETRISLLADEPYTWNRESNQQYLFYGDATRLFVTNNSALPGQVTIDLQTQAEHPEAGAIPWAAGSFLGLVLGFLLLRAVFPRVMAVATTTSKEAVAQPLFQIVLAIGIVYLTITVFIPYNTFGEDVVMLKYINLEFIMLLSIFVALWTASVGLADEIEGRTALTVLSKPIGRPQFLLGKYLGVLLPVLLMFLILGALFLLTVSFKTVYDARESAHPEPVWQRCYAEMITTLPGLMLAFMEAVVMAAISVAIATRLPMLANLSICFTIYIVGHLLPLLVQSEKVNDPFGIVQFMGQLFAVILPVLEHFKVDAAIVGGVPVPPTYLWSALGYCALYSCVAMLFALVLFEDRDLA